MIGNLIENVKVTHLTSDGTNYPLVAGTSDVKSGFVDMAGFDGCTFLVVMGDNVNGGTLAVTLEGCTTSGGTYAALTGGVVSLTAGASDTDDKCIAIDVKCPALQFLRLDINRGTQNTVIQSVIAIQYGPSELPVTQAVTAGQFNTAAAVIAIQNV